MINPNGYPEYEDAPEGVRDLLLNREAEFRRIGNYTGLTPPSRGRKYQGRAYGWDHKLHAIVFARDGKPDSLDAAESELLAVYEGQLASGVVPNQRHLYGRSFEAIVTGSKKHNLYGQPSLGGIAGLELHHAKEKLSPAEAMELSESMFPNLYREAIYAPTNRSNGPGDFRLGVIAAEETGMDESPIFDHQLPFKRRLRDGVNTPPEINVANTFIHFSGRLLLDRQRRGLVDDEPGRKRAREIFWVMPVQTQGLEVANLYATAKLAQKLGKGDEFAILTKFAEDIENQVLNDVDDPDSPGMWDPQARNGRGMFRDLDRHGRPINAESLHGEVTEETVASNLMALLLPNLKEHQLVSVVDMALEEFIEEFGLSTVGKYSPNYDPNHGEKESGRWRTPAWSNMLWLLAEASLVHINREDLSAAARAKCERLLNQLCEGSANALNKWREDRRPKPEFYSHLTGRGFRQIRVKWFGEANLVHVMPPSTQPSVFAEALIEQVRFDEEDLEPRAA